MMHWDRVLLRLSTRMAPGASSLRAVVSCFDRLLVQVLVGCLLTSCLVVILGWSRGSDSIPFWIFFGALDLVIIVALLLGRREIVEVYSQGLAGWRATAQKRPLTPNLVNTMLTATLTGAILPILFWIMWRPSLLKEVLVLTRDEVVSTCTYN